MADSLGGRLTAAGATFGVWAPHAGKVAVTGDFNGWTPTPLERGSGGVFRGQVKGAKAGDRYIFRITGHEGGDSFDKADPWALAEEALPGTSSVLASLDYDWKHKRPKLAGPMSVYEVHAGSWRDMKLRELAAPLAEHVKRLGFTHVELMPVMGHPFYGSWGYGVTGYFAVSHRYGAPEDLMFFVDHMHQHGLGVILDWVPAHFANDAHGLSSFDGQPLYERGIHPTWNTGLFDFSRPEVRAFLQASAMHWIETFHADGLRVDGVESILYKDHGRPGEKAKEEYPEGIAFLRELTRTLKKKHPDVVISAEDSSAWPGITRAPDVGGLGFDLKWDMGFSHDMRSYLAIDPLFRGQKQGTLTFRSVYQDTESFMIPLSHDDVSERGLFEQFHGDEWQKLANLRLLVASQFAHKGKKLLFMGIEIGQRRSWHHDRHLDWHEAHEGMMRMVRDLNELYRHEPALEGDFEWIDGTNAEMSVIVFARKTSRDYVVVALNHTPVPRHQYRIGVPRPGYYKEIFNSDARDYGGSGQGNMGGVEAVPYPWNERKHSIVVTLPPLGAAYFKV
jgi:1,4-alpha-glucan branching enzyme